MNKRLLAFFAAAISAFLVPVNFAFAYDWQTPLMWNWVLTTANPQLNQHEARIAQLEADNAALQTQLQALQNNSVMQLAGFIYLDNSIPGKPRVVIEAADLQVINGLGATHTVNGVGNIIIGYNEYDPLYLSGFFCSDGLYQDQNSCEAAGETWALIQHSGSHNLVMGYESSYTQSGGIVSGGGNTVNRVDAHAIGGVGSTVSGLGAVIVAGNDQRIFQSAQFAFIGGGQGNIVYGRNGGVVGGTGGEITADAWYATLAGGSSNVAYARYSSISGGFYNQTNGQYSSVNGGWFNNAIGLYSTVNGGNYNIAAGDASAVGGGSTRTAPGVDDWVAGGLFQGF